MTFLVGLGGFATVLLLGMVLPRVTGLLVFCFFATGCVQCGAGGDPMRAAMLLVYGSMIAWVMFDMGRMQRDEQRAKAKKVTPEVTP